MNIGYVNIFVSDIERSRAFYEGALGLTCEIADSDHGYASYTAGEIRFGTAATDDDTLVGRHTGIGFIVDDVEASYTSLVSAGVEFEMPPTAQPWGGTLAMFRDPDGNVFYLDPGSPA